MVLEKLVQFSNLYGSNEELVLAGGGNTSAKDGDVMYIKGSGTRLADITAEGFVRMSREKIAEIFTKTYPDNDKEREALSLADLMAAKLPGQENKRPSVETTLHSLFPHTFVLHLHPALVNGITCAVDGKKWAEKLFGDDLLWVDACRPGYTLAKICFDTLKEYKDNTGKDADMLLLQNHGIFIADDTVEGLEDKLYSVMSKIRAEIENEADLSVGEFDGEKAQEVFNTLVDVFGEDSVITYEPSNASLGFAESKETMKEIALPFNPDQIVYCKPYPVYAEDKDSLETLIKEYKEKNGFLPKVIFVKDCGLYGADYSEKGSVTAAALFNDAMKIAVYARSFGGALPMNDDLTDFIVNWEAESYRSKQ
jgi:rhamnose utilization protein RhaD (predicted bifunctional aldolase and dehydrogenase)